MSFAEDETATEIRTKHQDLLALQTNYKNFLSSFETRFSSAETTNGNYVTESGKQLARTLSMQVQDMQSFLELMNIAHLLFNQVEELAREKNDLLDELKNVQRTLATCELNLIQIQSENEHLKFLNELNACDKNDDLLLDQETLVDPIFRSPLISLRESAYSVNRFLDRSPCSVASVGSTGKARRKGVRFQGSSKENSPVLRENFKQNIGSYTMCVNNSINGDDLDELSDKLTWYESVIRQLQEIFGTENEDPDVTYHQESAKIIERAKRMMEYRSIVQDYETEINEHVAKNDRLQKSLDRLLTQKEECVSQHLSLPYETARKCLLCNHEHPNDTACMEPGFWEPIIRT